VRLYQDVVDQIESQIADGVYRVGDRLPSVRQATRSLGVSMTTIYHAYNLLESKGLIRAKPQSGYIVVAKAAVDGTRMPTGHGATPLLDLDGIARHVLGAAAGGITAPFGSVYPDTHLFPIARLLALMRDVSRHFERRHGRTQDIAGSMDLRREIARRHAVHGCPVALDEIIVTSGTIDAINLALATVTQPGDAIAVEDTCFFPGLFSLQRHGLRPVPVPIDAESGVDLAALDRVLASGEVKACLMMTSCHNPLGVTMPAEQKRALVRIIEKYQTPLIENDAYGDLLHPDECVSAKSFDTTGLVLRCSGFSNCLSPELRVGWITAGRFRDRMLSVKFLSSMASQWIAQDTVAEFLRHGNFSRHLRTLRSALHERMAFGVAELAKWRHLIVRQSQPRSGFMSWLELAPGTDSMRIYDAAARQGLSFVPGALFSVDRLRANEIALNFSFAWTPDTVRSVNSLMSLIADASHDGS
jgi:DNA-binding transcriptional MocR family regulator